MKKGQMSILGYFNLVGLIFTLWGKIYPSKDKMEWAAFRTCIFLGDSDVMIYFRVKPQFPSKKKKLESWWLMQFLIIAKGSLGFGGCRKGRGGWVFWSRFWWPALAASPKTRTTLCDY